MVNGKRGWSAQKDRTFVICTFIWHILWQKVLSKIYSTKITRTTQTKKTKKNVFTPVKQTVVSSTLLQSAFYRQQRSKHPPFLLASDFKAWYQCVDETRPPKAITFHNRRGERTEGKWGQLTDGRRESTYVRRGQTGNATRAVGRQSVRVGGRISSVARTKSASESVAPEAQLPHTASAHAAYYDFCRVNNGV